MSDSAGSLRPSGRSRLGWLAWLALGSAVGTGLWAWQVQRESAAVNEAARSEAAATQPLPAAPPAPASAPPSTTQPEPPRASLSVPRALAASAAVRAGCGISLPNGGAAAADAGAWYRAVDAGGRAAQRAATDKLLASAEPEPHAAGLFLSATGTLMNAPGCSGADCTPELKRREAALAELAALARDTASADIYAWGRQACVQAGAGSAGPRACEALSAQRWAELAPDNVWPWLDAAAEARRQADYSGEETAMYRAAQAADWRAATAKLARLLAGAAPPDAHGLPRLHVLQTPLNFESTQQAPGLNALSAYCARGQDANRQQTCARLTNRLLDQADNLLQLGMGLSLGERSGLPAARLAAVRAERDELQKLSPGPRVAESSRAATDCAGIEQPIGFMQRRAQVGELAALRERRQEAANSPRR